jgi:GDP-L-fucose synthase
MLSKLSGKRICVTGGAGFVGRVLCERLRAGGASDIFIPRSLDYDLTDAGAVARMYDDARPDVVIHLAAEVGGIGANQKRPGRFFFANMAMGLHLIEEGRRRGIDKFVQVGTVCAYPKHCPVPFCEDDLWNGYPEETNAPYGVAKRSLGVMLDAYRREYGFNGIYVIPVNLYGPGDNFDPETSHVIPALVRKFSEAIAEGRDEVTCWGTGDASREFMYVDDAANGILAATVSHDTSEPVNLGTGHEIRIADLAAMIAKECGFTGRIVWDGSRPDGQPKRQLDTTRAKERFAWEAGVSLCEGIPRTVAWWKAHTPNTHTEHVTGV